MSNLLHLPNEIWLDIPGYGGNYQASNLGRIKSIGRNVPTFYGKFRKIDTKLLKPINHKGYVRYRMTFNGKSKDPSGHRLVALTFIPNPDNLPEVNHKNGIKNDNRVENLEWCTHSHNILHAYETGLAVGAMTNKTGALHPNSKKVLCLETNQAFDSQKEAAEHLNISISSISHFFNRNKKTAKGYTFKYITAPAV